MSGVVPPVLVIGAVTVTPSMVMASSLALSAALMLPAAMFVAALIEISGVPPPLLTMGSVPVTLVTPAIPPPVIQLAPSHQTASFKSVSKYVQPTGIAPTGRYAVGPEPPWVVVAVFSSGLPVQPVKLGNVGALPPCTTSRGMVGEPVIVDAGKLTAPVPSNVIMASTQPAAQWISGAVLDAEKPAPSAFTSNTPWPLAISRAGTLPAFSIRPL